MADQELVRETANAIVGKLKKGEVTPLDLLDVLEKRIAEVDGKVNALPTLCFDRARDHAKALMQKKPAERGLLAGLPIPIKDLTDVAGVRTTQGSPIYKDNVPARSDILVEHLEENGGVIYAKSNTPEFGAGANTFNEVFGATRNPWDTSQIRGRLLRRRGGRARNRHGLARARLRHGRLAAQPRELLRHRRPAPEHRPRRAHAGNSRSTAISASRARWRAMSRTSRCCSTP